MLKELILNSRAAPQRTMNSRPATDIAETRTSLRPASQAPLSVQELVHHLRSGRTVAGEQIRPYKWLDFAGGERSPMELRISRVMESCSFKSGLSCVLGMYIL